MCYQEYYATELDLRTSALEIFSIYSIHGFGRPRTSCGRAHPLINPNFLQGYKFTRTTLLEVRRKP